MNHATVIVGAGGHAKVIVEILRHAGRFRPVACVSPTRRIETVLGVPVVGSDDALPLLFRHGVRHAFVAIGDNALRCRLIDNVKRLGFSLATAVSPAAHLAASCRIHPGAALMPGCCVGSDTLVAEGVIVNTGAVADHDCQLLQCCHVGPGASLAGSVHVQPLAFVATGATVIPNRTIGQSAIVGAGAVVVRDIPANMLAVGVPARVRSQQHRATLHANRQAG